MNDKDIDLNFIFYNFLDNNSDDIKVKVWQILQEKNKDLNEAFTKVCETKINRITDDVLNSHFNKMIDDKYTKIVIDVINRFFDEVDIEETIKTVLLTNMRII